MAADPRAIVECLLAAHYTEPEIVDYLVGTLGISEAAAFAALDGARPEISLSDFTRRRAGPSLA